MVILTRSLGILVAAFVFYPDLAGLLHTCVFSLLRICVVAVIFCSTKVAVCSMHLFGVCIPLIGDLVGLLHTCVFSLLRICVVAVIFCSTKIAVCSMHLVKRWFIPYLISHSSLFFIALLLYVAINIFVNTPDTTRTQQDAVSSQPHSQFRQRRRRRRYNYRPCNPLNALHPSPTHGTDGTSDLSSKKTCIVCYCNSDETSISGKNLTSECKHENHLCIECSRRYIHEMIEGGQVDNIRCVEEGCKSTLSSGDVKRFVTHEDFARYQTLLLRQLEKLPEFRWCSNPTCGSGQIHEYGERQPILTCHVCGAKTCFTHRTPWHSGRTCSQYGKHATKNRSRFMSEANMLQMLQRKGVVKRCPGCGQGVEKNGGCDHMRCLKTAGGCGAEFCWLCLANYNGPNGIRTVGNAAHRKTCKHYA